MTCTLCTLEDTPKPRLPRLPWARCGLVSLSLAALAAIALFLPDFGDALALRRIAVEHGAWWQLFTGHLAHFGATHFAWDVSAFLILGILAERRGLLAFLFTLFGTALFISAAVLAFTPGISEYRGLSGIDSALFTFVAVSLLFDLYQVRWWTPLTLISFFLLAFLGKIIFELATGHALFVQNMGPDVLPVALAHVVGGLWGAVVAVAKIWPDLMQRLTRWQLPDWA